MSESESRVCICDWLKSLSEADVLSAMACIRGECERRWPGSMFELTEEELHDPQKIMMRVAKCLAAMPESIRGKNQ